MVQCLVCVVYVYNYRCTMLMYSPLLVLIPSPGVNLPVEVVEALIKLLDISVLPLNVRAVLLEFGDHVVTAAFGQAQVLFHLRDH